MKNGLRSSLSVLAFGLLTAGCLSQTTQGAGGGPATGAAGPGGAVDAAASLERCSQPLGAIALVESDIYGLAQFGLSSPIPVLRLIMQQSNCFVVVERGQAFEGMMRERALERSGEARAGSGFQRGQMVTADLSLTPNIIFTGDTGGGGGAAGLASYLPGMAGIIGGAVASSVKFHEAETILTVVDNRRGVQVAVAQGSAQARDMSIGGALFGGGGGTYGGAGAGAYGRTPEGKVVTAALMDAHNKLVRSVRAMPPLPSVRNL